MNRKFKFTRRTALVISILLILTAALGSTLAYIVTQTPALINTFINGIDPVGDLTIEKSVEHPFDGTYNVSAKHFTFDVNLGSAQAGKTFGLYTADDVGIIEVSIPGGGSVTIPELPAGAAVEVAERDPGAGFTAPEPTALTIQRGENKVAVVNVYEPAPANTGLLKVSGVKKLVGREWQPGDRFVFALEVYEGTDENGSDKWRMLDTRTVEYSDQENFNTFDFTDAVQKFVLDEPRDYVFRVVEKEGSIPGITYDSAESRFTVSVGDTQNKMDGSLKLENVTTATENNTTVRHDGTYFFVNIAFENKYAPAGSAQVVIDIRKELTDPAATGRGAAGFEFTLYDRIMAETHKVTSDGLGNAKFTLTFEPKDIGKTFTYILRETEDPAMVKKGYTFDESVYVYRMTVGQKEDGTVAVTVEKTKFDSMDDVPATITFKEETPEETRRVEIPSMESVDTQEKPEENIQPAPATASAEPEPQSETEIPEQPESRREQIRRQFREDVQDFFQLITTGRISRDEMLEEMPDALDELFQNVQPEQLPEQPEEQPEQLPQEQQPEAHDEDVTVEQLQNAAWFTNVYQPKPATVHLDGIKTLTGRELAEEEFTFLIYETDSTYTIPEGAAPIRTATNTKEGTFDFADLELTECGWHYFVVKEDASAREPGIIYDSGEYRISILVMDLDGELCAQTLNISGKAKEILFENHYEPAGTKLTLTGSKILLGRELKAGEFTFNLYKANQGYTRIGDPVKTVNGLDQTKPGEFRFEIAYEKEQIGIYHYVITEEAGTEKDMTYDTGAYGIEVEVTDNQQGSLVARITKLVRLGETQTDADKIIFLNIYTGTEKPTDPTDPGETTKPTETTKPSSSGKLPQTGQLWWPVPVLLMLGIGLILVDALRRRGNRHER